MICSRVFRDGILKAAFAFFLFFSIPYTFADRITNTVTSSSARGLSMGEAVINSERKSNSIFYNPANIAAKNTGTRVEVMNLKTQASEGLVAQYGRGSSYNPTNLSSLYSGLKDHPNTIAYGGYSYFPNFTMRNISLGILYEVAQGAKVRAEDGALEVYSRNRFAPVGALSFRLFSGILKVGASVEYVTRGDANNLVAPPIDSTQIAYADFTEAGAGFRKNAGLTLTLPFMFLPSFSVVARDIGNTTYKGTPIVNFGEGRSVAAQPMTIDLAAAITVYLGSRVELKLEGDYRDFIDKSRASRLQHIQVGGELTFFDFINLRGGFAHGYTSYGLGLTTPNGSLNLGIYTDELNARLRTAPDTRFVLQYQFGLFN